MKLFWRILILVVVISGGYTLHRWGITTYLIGLRVALFAGSRHEHSTSDIRVTTSRPKGSVLILHGLNFDAEGMVSLVSLFHDLGYDVLAPRLTAHRADPEERFRNQKANWDAQIYNWGRDLKPPLICVGFSMGALLLMERQVNARLPCQRIIAFAPALSLHTPDWAIRLGRRLIPARMRFPSAIPPAYKHFAYIGLGPTFTMHDYIAGLRMGLNGVNSRRLPHGVLILDPRDKVVDSPAVLAMQKRYFPHWKAILVNAQPIAENHANHLLVDEAHLGSEQWADVVSAIKESLLNPPIN